MADSYRHLDIWKEATELSFSVYVLTKKFPKDELFNLVSQIRRASVSISSNIAEGSSRTSKKDNARFIEIAIGSLYEVESLIEISKKLEYIDMVEYDKMTEQMKTLGGRLGGFKKYLQK
jgi:four helix bundle protein